MCFLQPTNHGASHMSARNASSFIAEEEANYSPNQYANEALEWDWSSH